MDKWIDLWKNRGMRCSSGLRQRVVDCVRSGGSKAEAARRFKVGEASLYRWLKPGGLTCERPEPNTSHNLGSNMGMESFRNLGIEDSAHLGFERRITLCRVHRREAADH
ncbi:MAG: hypothetical protein CV088_16770 [Nitrospira sp. LK70]|nr:hypothetical protein [Nitrospira sp. LK70]